ncbi:hypothetical protein BpHYR1_021231 [Brachionus plicatilis]|uniref:Uncharacterized protein n=1 Tax=Brachionus plicatilis TaxID=10195 RepID=A0A3M7T2N4_BRAPC|nr:hypothetical protein BpHYR1_021231 [Brachionus plicatilis]
MFVVIFGSERITSSLNSNLIFQWMNKVHIKLKIYKNQEKDNSVLKIVFISEQDFFMDKDNYLDVSYLFLI